MPASDLFSGIAPILPTIISVVLFAVFGLVIFLVIRVVFARRGSTAVGGGGGAPTINPRAVDAVALLIDQSGRLSVLSFQKLSENIYVALGNPPKFLVSTGAEPLMIHGSSRRVCLPSNTPIYLALSQGFIVYPTDPSVMASIDILRRTGAIGLDRKDVSSLLIALMKLEEGKRAVFRVAPQIEVGFTFSPPDVLTSFIDDLLGKSSKTLSAIFANLAEWDRLSRYLESLSRYYRARYSWLIYIIAISIILMIMLIPLKMFGVI